jgi:hypothetical protein
MVTEWNILCAVENPVQAEDQWKVAPIFLQYLRKSVIGITAWSFDFMGSLILDWEYDPTSNTTCKKHAGGQPFKDFLADVAN